MDHSYEDQWRQLFSLLSDGYTEDLFIRLKWPEHEPDHTHFLKLENIRDFVHITYSEWIVRILNFHVSCLTINENCWASTVIWLKL